MGEDRGEQGAHLPGIDPLLAGLLEVNAEPEVLEYARKHDLHIDDFIEATASGQASEKRRRTPSPRRASPSWP